MLETLVVVSMIVCVGVGYCSERLTENIFAKGRRNVP